MLNILQVGESVAQNVCATLVLTLREEDYRNHAAAQAMDEARHHLAYRRFIDLMREEPEDIDAGTEMMFDALLAENDPLALIATEQFFLEGFAMNIFEGLRDHATHPLLRRIIELITRDESGVAHVLLNYCRHRGAEPAHGCGNARRFTCPYHGWVYDTKGALTGMPLRDRHATLDLSDFGLVELPC